MGEVESMAGFVLRASWDEIDTLAREALKVRVLDSLGCALGALEGEPIRLLREHLDDFGGRPACTLIGGGKTAPDRAAFYNGALVRYLDFNDSYLAPGETCHPSDNLGAVLAACEYAGASGKEALTALAVAYQVQCRLSDVAPLRNRGFDHVTQGAFSAAAGAAKGLALDQRQTANALAIAGTAYNALRVTRTGALSHWKGLAFPNTGRNAVHAAFLARRGITGPPEVLEGNKGWRQTVSGPWALDWSREGLENVRRTILKKYNAEIHSQSTLEAVLELRNRHRLKPSAAERVEVEVFDVAFNIIGGGEEGQKYEVGSKEQADHSLPYLVAVALLDGEVGPDQFRPERIRAEDVQALLRRVTVRPNPEKSSRFPEEMPVRVRIRLRTGEAVEARGQDYEGFHTRPMSWDRAAEKFRTLAEKAGFSDRAGEIEGAIRDLDRLQVSDLMGLLTRGERSAL